MLNFLSLQYGGIWSSVGSSSSATCIQCLRAANAAVLTEHWLTNIWFGCITTKPPCRQSKQGLPRPSRFPFVSYPKNYHNSVQDEWKKTFEDWPAIVALQELWFAQSMTESPWIQVSLLLSASHHGTWLFHTMQHYAQRKLRSSLFFLHQMTTWYGRRVGGCCVDS